MLPSETPEPLNPELERAQRRAQREREARRQAEALLEQKSLELYHSNERLRQQAAELESAVAARTAELQNALDQARAVTEAKSRFLATVSHEIRTPLNGIVGLADLLSTGELQPDQRETVQLLLGSSHLLMALINDLLDFSKIEAGHLQLEARDFQPREELVTIVETFRPQIEAKGLQLQKTYGSMPEVVRGDPLRLRQIVTNLLSNAVKFTERGTISVDFRMREEESRWRLIGCVTDTGIGFTPETAATLFEPFSQADSTITRKFGGTGLGLAISRRLARAMGGDLIARSDQVTRFTFEILLDASGIPPAAPTSNVLTELPERQVLVVDDNEVNRLVASSLLGTLRQTVRKACDGFEALEMCQAEPPDIILMDMQMPGLDGLETTRKLRRTGCHAWIIALTANAFESDRAQCLAAGMDDFLAKPLRRADLHAALAKAPARKPKGEGK